MQCPTCFQKLTVPQAPAGDSSKFILTASKVQDRPIPQLAVTPDEPKKKPVPYAAICAAVVFCLLAGGGVFVFRGKIFKRGSEHVATQADDSEAPGTGSSSDVAVVSAPVVADTNWTLNLAEAKIPDASASGRIHGSEFVCERAVLSGGRLDLRQGSAWPPDLGVSVYMNAQRGEELSHMMISVAANTQKPPRVTLRWKNERQEEQTQNVRSGYAMHVEFGKADKGRITGKIYLCTPDSNASWVAGSFDAEIRVPKPK